MDKPKLSKKVCLLGDFATGKTSLVRRFVYNRFDEKYVSTIGVNVSRKTIMVSHDDRVTELAVILWDLASQEEFRTLRSSYLRGSAGAIVVCDLTRPATLDSLCDHVQAVRQIVPAVRLVIAANKADLSQQWEITTADIESTTAQLNAKFFITSAKTGEQVDVMFRYLGSLLISANEPRAKS